METLFEAHLAVRDLRRSMAFYGDVLGLQQAHVLPERKVAFYWVGAAGGSMVGLWEDGASPQRMTLHVAFRVALSEVLKAPALFRSSGIEPLDFWGAPSDEPVVLGWMPAAAIYFHDPDGNLLELIAMLPDKPRPEMGVVRWRDWTVSPK